MKKLSLNEAGAKAVAWGSILAIPIPAVLLLVSRFCGDETRSILSEAARFSAAAGLSAIAVLLVLVAIELRQDARLIARYEAERSIRVRLASGGYECQYCGSRMRDAEGRRCRVCGR